MHDLKREKKNSDGRNEHLLFLCNSETLSDPIPKISNNSKFNGNFSKIKIWMEFGCLNSG